MANRLGWLAVILAAQAALGDLPELPGLPGPVDTLQHTGPSSNRVDVVFFGDGWTVSDSAALMQELRSHARTFLAQEEYRRYKAYFNIYLLRHFRPAPAGGISFDYGQQSKPYYQATATQFLAATDVKYVVCRGMDASGADRNMGITAELDDDRIGIHEVGHGWHGLGDLYEGAGHESWPNSTADPTGAKWARWLGYVDAFNRDTVGTYPIEQTRYFRPVRSPYTLLGHVRTRARLIVGTPIDREKMVHDIYKLVKPIDSHTPNTTTLPNPGELRMKLVDDQALRVEWMVNGVVAPQAIGPVFRVPEMLRTPGTFEVKARVYDAVIPRAFSDRGGSVTGTPRSRPSDSLDWVRDRFDDLQQTVTWKVQVDRISGIGPTRSPSRARNGIRLVPGALGAAGPASKPVSAAATAVDARGRRNPGTSGPR